MKRRSAFGGEVCVCSSARWLTSIFPTLAILVLTIKALCLCTSKYSMGYRKYIISEKIVQIVLEFRRPARSRELAIS